MKLTAAPIVRKPMESIGAPGMTDFVKIFIASELNRQEYRTTIRHEQSHVWSGHNRRRPKGSEVRDDLWKIACELEIARTIYDERDIENIKAPRSRLAGGYLPDSIDGLPDDVILAEDIYDWLVDNPDQDSAPRMMCCGCLCRDNSPDDEEEMDVNAAIVAARTRLDADEVVKESQVAVAKAYASIRNRPPTLADAVDAALRVRVEHERSYRRPSRRHDSEEILMRGAISVPRPPLVEIFVDRSGSFDAAKTAAAENRLNTLLLRYGATIRSDVWFFGNGKLVEEDPGGGGDTPYDLVAQHLTRSKPKLAIVITDDDPVSSSVGRLDSRITALCVPIGCAHTSLAKVIGAIDVVSER